MNVHEERLVRYQQRKNNIKSIKVVWSLLRRVECTCRRKASEGSSMRSRLYDFFGPRKRKGR